MAEWTTEDVRLRILRGFAESSVRDQLERQFSEWLTAHDAEVRAQAVRDTADAANLAWLAYRPNGWGSSAEDQEALDTFLWALEWLRARAERGEA